MTAKNRNKQSSAVKAVAPAATQDDAPRKSQKSPANGAGGGPAPQPSGSGICLKLASALFYVALAAAVGFSAFYLQKMLEEVHQLRLQHGERARENTELAEKMESAVQQVESLRSVVDGLESALGVTRVELEGATGRLKRSEVETRRVEEALQKLQNDLLRDLSEGISEVKEARERDFSSLETTVEDRLAELSRSIAASVAEFTEAQGEVQGQLADVKSRLGEMEEPALIKQELSAIVNTVAQLSTARQVAEASGDLLREQIGIVRAELQTRNQEVSSLSEEVEAVRTMVQETVGNLKQSVTAAEANTQVLNDQALTLEGEVKQISEAVHTVQEEMQVAAAQTQKRSYELEVRIKADEDSGESMAVSVSALTSKVESLLAKYDSYESTLAAQGQAGEKARARLENELEALKSGLEEFQSNLAALGGAQSKLASRDSSLGEQVEELEKRLVALEGSNKTGSNTLEELEKLRGMVDGWKEKAVKLEGHEKAISALQDALKKTTMSLATLSRAPGKNKN
ncbi:cytoskeleton-associated protein 4 [Lampris incognitus]|uniref:cytoskeleton-associated protein 4 n=1 Tax=Lampris incognitus TaxID=2546036 RepID=UPI0024B54552|nr:cytoskeleton-associated protein 4 [Lampris incognitus]